MTSEKVSKPTIFISHSHRDIDFVRKITRDLTDNGAIVWLDEATMYLGDSLLDKISSAIHKTDFFLIVLSEKSIRSSWVEKELQSALEKYNVDKLKNILPIKLDNCNIPEFLHDIVIADFSVSRRYREALDLILRKIGLPDHPNPEMKAAGMQWPLPEEAFKPWRLIALTFVFYNGIDFSFLEGITFISPDSSYIKDISLSALLRGLNINQLDISRSKLVHYESGFNLNPEKTFAEEGIKSGELVIVAVEAGCDEPDLNIVSKFDLFRKDRPLSNEGTLYHQGLLCIKKDPEKALNFFDQVLLINPLNVACLYDKVNCLEQLNRVDESLQVLLRAFKVEDCDLNIWTGIISKLYNKGKIDIALLFLEPALEMHKSNPELWYYLGRCLQDKETYDYALSSFEKSISIDENFVLGWIEKGVTLNCLDRYLEAIHCFDKVLDFEPDHDAAWINKGYSYEKLCKIDEAIQCFNFVLKLIPNHTVALQNKGSALLRANRPEDAKICFYKVLQLEPSKELASEAQRGIQLCDQVGANRVQTSFLRTIKLQLNRVGLVCRSLWDSRRRL